MWLFEDSGGVSSLRLLRVRAGHSAPPRCVRFEHSAGRGADSSGGGGGPDVNVLSAGEDSAVRSFSLAHESCDRSFGRASFDKAATSRSGLKRDRHCMPPIVAFAHGIVFAIHIHKIRDVCIIKLSFELG